MIFGVGVTAVLLTVVTLAAIVTAWRRPIPALAGGNPARRTVPALARTEGVRLLRHPLVVAGAIAVPTGFPYFAGSHGWEFRWGISGVHLNALAMAAMIVVHRAVTRDRRSGTDELAASLPVGMRTRVRAHVLSLAWLLLPAWALWVVYVPIRFGGELSRVIADGPVSYLWEPSLLELAQGPVSLAIYLLIGVAAGVWWRHSAVGIVVAYLMVFSPLVWMFPMVIQLGYQGTGNVSLGAIHTFGHYVFLAGVATFALGGALVRHGPRRLWLMAVAVGAVGALIGSVLHPGLG